MGCLPYPAIHGVIQVNECLLRTPQYLLPSLHGVTAPEAEQLQPPKKFSNNP